ncbi:hypothetical protein [Nisaea sp.]|uniref:hypothetical protein n=1 Tax=Nisaea sp. TaxID=2024842 RepID=UPI003B51E791
MPKKSLEPNEIALIKAMLNRGMRNNEIQFHFNRPDRPVNSGRITEIKGGLRWADISPATDDELDRFLSPSLPSQEPSGAVFSSDGELPIKLVSAPPSSAPEARPEQIELYSELKVQVASLLESGDNLLGGLGRELERFSASLPEDIQEAMIVTIWSRGNALRAALKAHDKVSNSADFHPSALDPGIAEKLRGLLSTFNIFILSDSRGSTLESQSAGPNERDAIFGDLKVIQEVIDDVEKVADEDASQILREQFDEGLHSLNDEYGNRALVLASKSSKNFVTATIVAAFHRIRNVTNLETHYLLSAIQKNSDSVGRVLGESIVVGEIFAFVLGHSSPILTFLERIHADQVLFHIVRFIQNIF